MTGVSGVGSEKRPGATDFLILLVLACAWGSAFAFIKIAVETIPPFTLVASRVILGALVLAIIARLKGRRLPRDPKVWRLMLVIGLFGSGLPFVLVSWGETRIDSALAAIVISATPLFTVILAHYFADGDRMSAGKITGIALGFAGVVLLVGPDALGGVGGELLGQLAVIGAAFCYALTNIFAARAAHLPLTVSATCSLMGAAFWILPLSLVIDRPWTLSPSGDSVLAALWLALISSALGTMLFFRLLRTTSPSFVSLNNYIIPALGVLFGAVMLSEEVSLRSMIALGLILSGIAAATLLAGRRKKAPR